MLNTSCRINTLRQRQNGRQFADNIFKCIFLNENILIPIKISLTFVRKGSINNIPALVQIMAWRRPGDKPLSEPMMVNLPTHICVTRPQWVNDKDRDLNPVSYQTEKKIYSFLTMCKQWHICCKQPTQGFFSCCHFIYLVRPGANFRRHQDDRPSDQKFVLKLFDHTLESAK